MLQMWKHVSKGFKLRSVFLYELYFGRTGETLWRIWTVEAPCSEAVIKRLGQRSDPR